MTKSNLFGRRVHISGSISKNVEDAKPENVDNARKIVKILTEELVTRGVNFVIPVDTEPLRDDGKPLCFDWLIWKSISESVFKRPNNAPEKFAVAVMHEKNFDQIPADNRKLWDEFSNSTNVDTENVIDWNMNCMRMEQQAKLGELLIILGGGEGVEFLANKYYEQGKPVIPLDLPICKTDEGARRVLKECLKRNKEVPPFFANEKNAHSWLNTIKYRNGLPNEEYAKRVLNLLDSIEKPHAFAIRLLDESDKNYDYVDEYFTTVVKPIVENKLGFNLITIDKLHKQGQTYIIQEIFTKIHQSRVVFADITGCRPNCFLELGYAFGRSMQFMITAMERTKFPFDVAQIPILKWNSKKTTKEKHEEFINHWNSNRNCPPINPIESLIK